MIFTTATSDLKTCRCLWSGSGEDVAPGHRVSCTKTLKKVLTLSQHPNEKDFGGSRCPRFPVVDPEEEQQDAKKPDPTRQYNLQLDSKLTITTKRRHLSSEPTDEKGLRLKYSIMTNLWLLAQMLQPGRSIYADFAVLSLTFSRPSSIRTILIFLKRWMAAL